MKLPETVTKTLYLTYRADGLFGDEVQVMVSDMSDMGYITLGTEEVTLNVPQVNVTEKQIDLLRNKRQSILDEASAQASAIQEKIESLQAIEYQEADQWMP